MSTRIIDLTESDSDSDSDSEAEQPSPASKSITAISQPRAAPQPLSDVRNGSRANAAPAQDVPPALITAINTMEAARLRMYVREFCRDIPEVRDRLAAQTLVRGKDVIRYHKDSDSEDDVDSEIEGSEEGQEDRNGNENAGGTERVKPLRPIAVEDDELVPLYAKCLNCKQEFDVSTNYTRECHWHTGKLSASISENQANNRVSGEKELYEDDDFWADHDDQCHGDPYSFRDDEDYAEGFKWSCCDNLGGDEGCKTTKHKAPVNVIQSIEVGQINKRRAEEEIARPVYARCAKCEKRYDINDNTTEECASHPGMKLSSGPAGLTSRD